MQLYLTMKMMPELRNRSWKERRQALWKAGLKPYRSPRVWLAMALSALVVLWALDLVVGMMVKDPSLSASNKGFAGMLTLLLIISIPAFFMCWHSYIRAMRPHLARFRFDPDGSWFGALFKGLVMDVLFAVLFAVWVLALDWAINSYDEAPDPRIKAVMSWPEPIPDENNGYLYAAGLQAAPGTPPFEAGRRWLTGVNDAILKHAQEYPKAPAGLRYAAYVPPLPETRPDAGRTGNTAQFCLPGRGTCLAVVHQEQKAVEAWLAANRELLTRYLALQKYLQWQDALDPGDPGSPMPAFASLLRAQSLMHAAVLQSVEKKQTAKALQLLGDDIHFVRNMLGSKDNLVGKMIATTMLARDLAVLAEIMDARPNDLKPNLAQIEKMTEPLSPAQVSVASAFRFEERFMVAVMSQYTLAAATGNDLPTVLEKWGDHHFKKNASVRLTLDFWDQVIRRTDVRDAAYTPPLDRADVKPLADYSRLTGFMHNQAGKVLAAIAEPEYINYPNRLCDLNSLNNLLRLRVALARNGLNTDGVPDFIVANQDKTLNNPQTGKPYSWDNQSGQIYFTPNADWYSQRFSLGGTIPGRVALSIPAPAAKTK